MIRPSRYLEVGLIAVIGLSAKNAILIIEFANTLRQSGRGLIESTLEACRLRFRPILMTSIAFILGGTPLALSSGAGANSRHAIGTCHGRHGGRDGARGALRARLLCRGPAVAWG